MNNLRPKLLVDVDTGIDDALAILYLASLNKYDISITTTGGNCSIENVVNNTLGVIEKFNLKIDVYKGAASPIRKKTFQHAYDFHGKNGIGNINLPNSRKLGKLNADDYIIKFLKSDTSKKTLVWLSPLTNLAMALAKDPTISNFIEKLVIMGGAVDVKGNETKYAEFNFFQDPHAVKIVFEHLDTKIKLVSLDVTDKCPIKESDLIKFNLNMAGNFTKEAIQNWYEFFGRARGRNFFLYDPLAVSALDMSFIHFKQDKFSLETEGLKQGHITKNGKYQIKYSMSVDAKKFISDFIEKINQIG